MRAYRSSPLLALLLAGCVGDPPSQPVTDASTTDGAPDVIGTTDAGPDVLPACGAPSVACCNGTTCNGGSVCNAGTCVCTAPAVACGAQCVTLATDPKNCGACGHDCLGGACTAGKCQPITLATGQSIANGIAIDADGVYWTHGSNNSVKGAVGRVKLDGTGLKILYDSGINSDCFSPAVGSGVIYFSRSTGGTRNVMKCDLPDCTGGAQVVVASQPLAQSVHLDTANNRLYWVNGTPYQGTGGAVMTFSLPNGPPTRVVTLDQPNPVSLALGNGFVYWLNGGTYVNNAHQGNGSVRRAPLGQTNGSATTIVTHPAADLVGLAIDAQSVYFGSGNAQTLEVAPVGGGGSSSTLASPVNGLGDVAADGTNVYWTDSGPNARILTCPRTGCPNGTPIVLATNQASPRAIAVDAVSVVWANVTGGEIRRVAK